MESFYKGKNMSNWFMNLIWILVIVWSLQIIYHVRKGTNQQQSFTKEKILGERFTVQRNQANPVQMNLYRYDAKEKVGLIVVGHGGNLMNGSADMTDSFCDALRNQSKSVVISIDYTKLQVNKPPYQQQEIIDTVLYFMKHSEEYNIEQGKVVFVGFSSGAYLQVGAASILQDLHQLTIKGQIAFYPLLDDSIIQLTDRHFLKYPITVVSCNNPTMNQRIALWCEHMQKVGVEFTHKEYPDAMQGFIEYNYPEYLENPKFKRNLRMFNDDQKDMANACFMWLVNEIEQYMHI